jgi:hypothetical protein
MHVAEAIHRQSPKRAKPAQSAGDASCGASLSITRAPRSFGEPTNALGFFAGINGIRVSKLGFEG